MSMERTKTCGNCRWWQLLKDFGTESGLYPVGDEDGVCRRLSPGVIDNVHRAWPGTHRIDWCGEWTMTEEAEAEARKVVDK